MPKILIVDDDRTTMKLLKTLLEMDGFEVFLAANGQSGIEMAQSTGPDILMVDFHLADMEGIELVTALRAIPAFAHTPIVVASGLNVETEALAAGADLFLIKPFEPNRLADVLLGLIG